MNTSSLDEIVDPLRNLREQFLLLTEPHRPALWRYCLHLTGSPWDAEDLVQETLLRAFARLGHVWQPITNARAYLFRIASNTWIDTLRRGNVQLDPLDEANEIADAASASARAEVSEALAQLAAWLPPRQRTVLLLVDVFDFTAREVSAMLGATEGAVRAVLHRARTTLARARALQQDAAAPSEAPASSGAQDVLVRFVDAFNRRDADAIVALLDVDASADIIGIADEYGREVIAGQSLREAMAEPLPQRAELGTLAGEPIVAIYAHLPGQPESLQWLIRLGIVGEKICTWKAYFFTPDLVTYAAEAFGVPAMPMGYRYVAPEPAAR